MAYQGTTSTSPNVPNVIAQGITRGSTNTYVPRSWIYNSTHISSDVSAVNFFTDGNELGMRLGDTLIAVESTTYIATMHTCVAVGSTTTDFSVGTTVSSGV